MTAAWGNWGPEDERGALNRITDSQVRDAGALVRRGMVIDLAQPISPRMAVPKHRPGMMHFMGRDGGDYAAGRRARGGFHVAEDTIVLPVHSGTHLDALCHCWTDGTLYNGFSGAEVRSDGAHRLGIDKLGPIVTRGVLLDFVALNGGPLEDGTTIGAEMTGEAIGRAGTKLRPGDAVLLRTGWLERQADVAEPDFNAEPGIDIEAANLLAESGVALVGADNYAVEVLPFAEETVFPVHQRLIRDCGVPLLEGLVLRQLAETGGTTFLFMASPLPIRGGTGSPVAPVAVL
jgi:kynurenine formamidase